MKINLNCNLQMYLLQTDISNYLPATSNITHPCPAHPCHAHPCPAHPCPLPTKSNAFQSFTSPNWLMYVWSQVITLQKNINEERSQSFYCQSNFFKSLMSYFCCLLISWWIITFNRLVLLTKTIIITTASMFKLKNTPAAAITANAYWSDRIPR